jgi:hypothetical protein
MAAFTLVTALGLSPACVNKVLHELAASGRIVLETGKTGTMVRLMVPTKSWPL